MLNSRLVFAILFPIAIFVLYIFHSVSSRDPTSLLFNPRTGYTPAYSTRRKQEAEYFVASYANHTSTITTTTGTTKKRICVGIPSIARKGARYLRVAVGSLLDGLTEQEREQIHLVVFIPHSDPTIHPAYTEQWLSALADEVLTYDVSAEEMQHIKDMEAEGGLYREKGLYDYSYLIKQCYETGIEYMALLEDDIVAMDGWYHRTMAAIEDVEKLSTERKKRSDWLYLRLFYTEEFLGWNSEEWSTYLIYSLIAVGLPAVLLSLVRLATPNAKRAVSGKVILVSSGAALALVLSFFVLGRATVLPLPAGVNEMPKYGCCSQGFVFPREKAMTLARWYEEKKYGFVDVLTEEYADQHGELRWAITPSVIQHVGGKSSKVDDYGPESKFGMTVAEKIWNFRFERFNPAELRREHEMFANENKVQT
jgi:hypothetical protein